MYLYITYVYVVYTYMCIYIYVYIYNIYFSSLAPCQALPFTIGNISPNN